MSSTRLRRGRVLARGEVVCLRSPAPADTAELLALYRASRAFYRGLAYPPTCPEQIAAYLARCDADDFDGLLVCRRSDGAILGTINISQIVSGGMRSAFMGYQIGAPFARHGYMTEALGLALRHVFVTLALHRIEANIQPGNEASLALVRRAGFTREGYSRRYLKIGGRWRDHERWALLEEDWRRLRRAKEPSVIFVGEKRQAPSALAAYGEGSRGRPRPARARRRRAARPA